MLLWRVKPVCLNSKLRCRNLTVNFVRFGRKETASLTLRLPRHERFVTSKRLQSVLVVLKRQSRNALVCRLNMMSSLPHWMNLQRMPLGVRELITGTRLSRLLCTRLKVRSVLLQPREESLQTSEVLERLSLVLHTLTALRLSESLSLLRTMLFLSSRAKFRCGLSTERSCRLPALTSLSARLSTRCLGNWMSLLSRLTTKRGVVIRRSLTTSLQRVLIPSFLTRLTVPSVSLRLRLRVSFRLFTLRTTALRVK